MVFMLTTPFQYPLITPRYIPAASFPGQRKYGGDHVDARSKQEAMGCRR